MGIDANMCDVGTTPGGDGGGGCKCECNCDCPCTPSWAIASPKMDQSSPETARTSDICINLQNLVAMCCSVVVDPQELAAEKGTVCEWWEGSCEADAECELSHMFGIISYRS